MQEINFKLTEANGTTSCAVLIRPAAASDGTRIVQFDKNAAGDLVASKPLASGRYFIEWVMFGSQGGTLEIAISDADGKPLRPAIKDKNETGKPFKWNANEFTVK
jgi:hypothetical protein